MKNIVLKVKAKELAEEAKFVRTADFHSSDCTCFRCSIDALASAVAGEV